MGNNLGVIELTQSELRECNGGFIKLIISVFLPSITRIFEVVEGYTEGYTRGTPNP